MGRLDSGLGASFEPLRISKISSALPPGRHFRSAEALQQLLAIILFYTDLSSDETGPPKQSLDGAPSKVRKNAMGRATRPISQDGAARCVSEGYVRQSKQTI
jgi:hypothetical protein